MKQCEGLPKRIFVCSRYAGDLARNTEVAEKLCRVIALAGCVPFAPHLFYTRFLDDDDPAERRLGITLGLSFMAACDEVWVYARDGISSGMKMELEHAVRLGKPIVEIQEVQPCPRI